MGFRPCGGLVEDAVVISQEHQRCPRCYALRVLRRELSTPCRTLHTASAPSSTLPSTPIMHTSHPQMCPTRLVTFDCCSNNSTPMADEWGEICGLGHQERENLLRNHSLCANLRRSRGGENQQADRWESGVKFASMTMSLWDLRGHATCLPLMPALRLGYY